jgi:DNA polymerase III subunit delta'
MWQVIGQSKVVSMLQHSLEAGTLAHAYLLAGPEHVGKMKLAVNLAQALNCQESDRPCLKCDSCKRIEANNHADVQVIGLGQNDDAAEAKLISIDQIKQIQHSVSLPPFEGKCKVFIIDHAELMSTEAANCLLKTLEEPGDNVVFLLLTVNDRLLPSTVVSRCQRLEILPLSIKDVQSALVSQWGVTPERARLLAGLSHGCPGQAIAAALNDSLLEKRNEDLSKLVSIITSDYEARFAFATQLAAQFTQNRRLVSGLLAMWLDYWRDLMLVKLNCSDMITNSDHLAGLVEMARGYTLGQIRGFMESIRQAGEQLRQNANPRLALEVLMLDIPGEKKEVVR